MFDSWVEKISREGNGNPIQDSFLENPMEMGFARDVADRVFFIDEGIIMEQGTPEQVFGNPQNPRTQSFLNKVL